MKSLVTAFAFFILLMACFSMSSVNMHSFHDGKGMDSIFLRKTTASQIISRFGKQYEVILHHNASGDSLADDTTIGCTEYKFAKQGLSFMFWGKDTTRLYTIQIKPLFNGRTDKGVSFDMTMENAMMLYGQRDLQFMWGYASLTYPGVTFYCSSNYKGSNFPPNSVYNATLQKKINQIDICYGFADFHY